MSPVVVCTCVRAVEAKEPVADCRPSTTVARNNKMKHASRGRSLLLRVHPQLPVAIMDVVVITHWQYYPWGRI
jgi:hypothetical protein